MIGRLGIDDVRPVVSARTLPSKAVVGEVVPVTALVWREGHDAVAATLTVLRPDGEHSQAHAMTTDPENQDRVHGVFVPDEVGTWAFRVDAWSDVFATWRNAVYKKRDAGQSAAEMDNDLQHGATLFDRAAQQTPAPHASLLADAARDLRNAELELDQRLEVGLSDEVTEILRDYPLRDLLTRGPIHEVKVERTKAGFSSWYELFPRSTGAPGEHGTFATTAEALERVAEMGFDTVYFPPIHPIGEVNRKGRNNTLTPEPEDVGSPWAIGSADGGHDAVHPQLGTLEDFRTLVSRAEDLGLEVALDLALQAAPDHPWAAEHPEFFTVLADGTIAYAENPPKKYQDIYPLNFDNDPAGIYAEVYRVVKHWIDNGVRTFRVDNPHTKPTNFWAWLIEKVHETDPDVIFLAEAFTRPARLFGLAKAGFSQSYTYFTWKTTKDELIDFGEMIRDQADISRPNLFVNTPDILHESLQTGGRAMFAIRAVLASTLSPLWGVYSGYELYEHVPVRPGSEEYLDSEKYQIRHRDFEGANASGDSLEPFITTLNRLRREQPALQQLRTLHFHPIDNDRMLAYSKVDPHTGNTILVVVTLDPHYAQEATVHLDFDALGREPGEVGVHDLITGSDYTWGEHNFVRLEPRADVAHVFVLPDVTPDNRERIAWRHVTDYRG
ncbi:alpha-1,4-glucan--maltose-1-phosphate maltosyltransferase [Corynebacterium yudongzhengii]|uniref:Alpha-1,4-glucan:maltose-1-phosphate maltosyltransferase n=1 Tax=Corynebacterium yudongzhengii TaxID=2080740 RepID=A0A2U1T9I1_9CORY|nr:alpha-1,4-glucan--maltose-1-phosphate maltosyltransferase [Corynebacterium yudongzhengii]AWB82091.1 alpha-1,4-glucan--maltose-1-phosphate maltosyltransferase [Corynebacterium yudongzhengii]PWC02595.1 alpha-1,4-glucan--maltose-1-phosphate maltosyltransferase [Corynebacterium yudongzhengii]